MKSWSLFFFFFFRYRVWYTIRRIHLPNVIKRSIHRASSILWTSERQWSIFNRYKKKSVSVSDGLFYVAVVVGRSFLCYHSLEIVCIRSEFRRRSTRLGHRYQLSNRKRWLLLRYPFLFTFFRSFLLLLSAFSSDSVLFPPLRFSLPLSPSLALSCFSFCLCFCFCSSLLNSSLFSEGVNWIPEQIQRPLSERTPLLTHTLVTSGVDMRTLRPDA